MKTKLRAIWRIIRSQEFLVVTTSGMTSRVKKIDYNTLIKKLVQEVQDYEEKA